MSAQAASLSTQDMANLAAFFSSQKVKKGSSDTSKAGLGEKIYRGGNKATDVVACMACHGPSGEGNPAAKFPLLSGQNVPYVVKSLDDFRSAKRKNDPNGMMRRVTSRMTDKEIKSVAGFISGLH